MLSIIIPDSVLKSSPMVSSSAAANLVIAIVLLPVVFRNHGSAGSNPLEVPDQLRVLHHSLASEEEVSAHGHAVRACGDDLQRVLGLTSLNIVSLALRQQQRRSWRKK